MPATEAPRRPRTRRPVLPQDYRRPRLPLERLTAALRSQGLATTIERSPDSWPRTTRVLPWSLALFIAILWLLPINSISLSFSTPIDLKLDRIVLPFIFGLWLLTAAVGGRAAPRMRVTPIHVGIGAFVGLAFLSVVVNAVDLNQTQELQMAMKKLTIIASYATIFIMVASVIRPSEIHAFMTFTLVLACLAAVGTLWEYHFHYNVFYEWAAKLLPPPFVVGIFDSSRIDEIGRPETRGPAELGLEVAAMMAIALPIALVRVIHSPRGRKRVWYALAACLLLAASASTFRKTGLLAPVAVVGTLAFFRRRELLKLAPLGIVVILFIHVVSPGALGGIGGQLSSSRLKGASTVSDRSSDYDAIRPDVWSHIVMGRGFGSYDQTKYRILDSEILDRVVEGGVLGLLAYIGMMATAVGTMAPIIRRRDPTRAPPALMIAASAVVFLLVSALYDAMSFPHMPYLFMVFAGMGAVLYHAEREGVAAA